MSKLYTAKDLELLIKQGQCLDQVPADAKLTPMARDLMRKHRRSAPAKAAAQAAPVTAASKHVMIHDPVLPNAVYEWKPGGDPKTAAEIERFFYSKEIQALKQHLPDWRAHLEQGLCRW